MSVATGTRAGGGNSSAPARAFWSALDAASGPAASLLALAGLVRALSAQDYGILVIATAASTLSVAVNPAIAATTTRFIAGLGERRDTEGRALTGMITTSLIAVVVMDAILLTAVRTFIRPISGWVFGANMIGNQSLHTILLLSIVAVGMQQVDVVLAAAIRGLERFRRQALAEMVSRSAFVVITVLVAWWTGSVTHVLAAQCVVCLASLAMRAVLLRRVVPGQKLLGLPTRASMLALLKFGGWMWFTAIAGMAYMSLDRIIIGRVAGAAVAGRYNVYLQIAQLIHFIPSSLFAFLLPEFSRLAANGGSGAQSTLPRLFGRYRLIIVSTAAMLALAITLIWRPLFGALVGEEPRAFLWGTVGILTMSFLVLACNIAPYYLLLAIGRSREVSLISSVSMLISVVLMMLLIPVYGVEGAAISRLAYGVGTLAFFYEARRQLKSTSAENDRSAVDWGN